MSQNCHILSTHLIPLQMMEELTINSGFLEKQEYGDQLTTIKIFLVINYCKTAKCKKLVI